MLLRRQANYRNMFLVTILEFHRKESSDNGFGAFCLFIKNILLFCIKMMKM